MSSEVPPRKEALDVRIAISGKSGCGNSTVSRLLAEMLGVRLINYTFHTVAQELGIDFDQLCRMAEEDPSWDRLVDTRQIELANQGPCVLGSRLAIWIWKEARLRIFLEAPLEVRAARIQQREGGSYEEVLQKTRLRDERDHARYLRLYGIDNDDVSVADWVIDTTKMGPHAIAEAIARRYLDQFGRS